MIEFISIEGTNVCRKRFFEYSNRWKQPINVSKTVVQIFHSQVRQPQVEIFMGGKQLETVRSFKYLGFTWTDKLSLKPTVNKCLESIQKSYVKLKWLKRNKNISTEVLRLCFFAYSFPFFTGIFPFFPLLPKTQKELFVRKYRVGLRIIHRCPLVAAQDLLTFVNERNLESYVSAYLQKRLSKVFESDLGKSLFLNDIFYWDNFTNKGTVMRKKKRKKIKLDVGHFFRLARVQKMMMKHESHLLQWLSFIDNNPI